MRNILPSNKGKLELVLDGTPPCVDQTDIFYPSIDEHTNQGTVKTQSDAAKAICVGCPFQNECLEVAAANNEHFGIWGGVNFGNGRERRRFFESRKPKRKKAS
jgi:hypothetical protein